MRPFTSLRFGCGLAIIGGLLILPLLSLPVVQWLRTLSDFDAFVVITAASVTTLVTVLYLAWERP